MKILGYLTFSLGQSPNGMTIGAVTGLVQWTPSVAQTGTHSVSIQVDDGRGGVGTQSYTLSVVGDGPNQPPTITSRPDFVATAGDAYSYQIVATDPEGLALTFQLINSPTAW